MKIRLLNVISNFKENFNVTKNCLEIGDYLLKNSFNRLMHISIYNSMTILATRNCVAVPQQVKFYYHNFI